MPKVCILDYGSGNVRSVYNLFTSVCRDVTVSNDAQDIDLATHIVLPGVGAFGPAMRKINEKLPLAALQEALFVSKKPFLGICVGMQVMADRGFEFGEHAGLGWVRGVVDKVEAKGMPLPHIGWNNIHIEKSCGLLAGLEGEPDFYFVHSFAFRPKDSSVVVATAEYGEEFCCVIQSDNLYGTQFHPEKSQRAGQRLAQNFLELG